MPVAASAHGHSSNLHIHSRARPSGIAEYGPVIRPKRKSVFPNPDWPPVPDRDLPTPAGVRAARARALSASMAKVPVQTATIVAPVLPTQHQPKLARAEQVQARAIAAQAAHQQRLAAINAAKPPSPVPAAVRRPVSFLASYHFGHNHGGANDMTAFDLDMDVMPVTYDPASTVSYPSLNSDDSMDLLDELQVDMSLPLAVGSPIDEAIHFTSPSATVDISAFLPPPGPPVLVANDATIAASAVPLADWATGLCSALVSRFLSPHTPTAQEQTHWFAELAGRRDASRIAVTASPALRTFVSSMLSATLPSPQCLFLGFFYISKLPIGNFRSLPQELDHAATPLGVRALFESFNKPAWTKAECAFREVLYGKNHVHTRVFGDAEDEEGLHVAQLVVTLAIMLGNKWLEDNTFTTRTWYDVTSLSQTKLKNLETAALDLFGFSLAIQDHEWRAWLGVLRVHTSHRVAKEAIGVVGTTNGLALARLDHLLQVVDSQLEGAVIGDTAPYSPFEGDDVVLVPYVPLTPRSVPCHTRTTSLPMADMHAGTTASDLFSHYVVSGAAGMGTRPVQHYGWDGSDGMDAFQFHAPHPAVASAAMEARRRRSNQIQMDGASYRWDQIQEEMAAREREQELLVSAWPRPSSMDWSSAWSRSSIVGI